MSASPYGSDGVLRFGPTFLAERFRAFHAELLRSRAEAELSGEAEEAPATDGPGDPAAVVSQRLGQWLERAAVEAQRLGGGLGGRLFRDASFVMAALADEILLHGPVWRGQARWSATLLESRLFNSYDAGDRVFDRLDGLLASRDPIETPLAEVFLLALKLGFEGRYRGEADGPSILDRYRGALFEFIANRAPDLAHPNHPLIPAAYAHTLSRTTGRRLPYLWNWLLLLLLFLGLFVLFSHMVWLRLTVPVLAIIGGGS
jgi:type VI secretion system protein ImpK